MMRSIVLLALCASLLVVEGAFVVNLLRDDNRPSTPADKPLDPTQDSSARFVFDVQGYVDPLPFECTLDNMGFWAPCSSPLTIPGLTDGPHTFSVRVPGNPSTSHTWTIDTTSPFVILADFPPKISPPLSRGSFILTSSEPVLFQCFGNAQPEFANGFVPCDLALNSSVLSLSLSAAIPLASTLASSLLMPGVEMQSGRYFMQVRAVDAALNISPVLGYEWSVDSCINQNKCREKTCAGSVCDCGQGFYLDLTNDHICRSCEPVVGCTPTNVHCTNGIDSLCGSCTSALSQDLTTNSFNCGFVVNWN